MAGPLRNSSTLEFEPPPVTKGCEWQPFFFLVCSRSCFFSRNCPEWVDLSAHVSSCCMYADTCLASFSFFFCCLSHKFSLPFSFAWFTRVFAHFSPPRSSATGFDVRVVHTSLCGTPTPQVHTANRWEQRRKRLQVWHKLFFSDDYSR